MKIMIKQRLGGPAGCQNAPFQRNNRRENYFSSGDAWEIF
jgi:hypothetical protein